jgi:hypothetical protein
MYKFLITTSSIIGLATNAVSAETKVTIGGMVDSKVVNVNQRNIFKYKDPSNPTNTNKLSNNNISTDAYLIFNLDSKLDNGLKYGGLIKLNTNTSKAKKESYGDIDPNGTAEKVMMYVESDQGRVEIGNYTGVTNSMKVNAATFASATGGIDGDSQYYWNKLTCCNNHTYYDFIQTPNLPTNELGTVYVKGKNAGKINYYTPEYKGWRFGSSYTPDLKAYGTAAQVTDVTKHSDFGFKNIFGVGLSYMGEVKNVGLKVAATSEFGKNKNSNNKNLKAWQFGGNASYRGVTVGGSYGSWGRFDLPNDNDATPKTHYWTAGLGYEYGPISTSITYLESKKGLNQKDKLNKFTNAVLGVDYKMAPGMLPYVEFSSFKMKDRVDENAIPPKESNKGHIVMTGIKLSF